MIKVRLYKESDKPDEIEVEDYEFKNIKDFKIWITIKTKEFKLKNMVIDEKQDKSFIDFKNQLVTILLSHIIKDYHYCNKCPVEAYENRIFCRCEDRNMRIAKARRENGYVTWPCTLTQEESEGKS